MVRLAQIERIIAQVAPNGDEAVYEVWREDVVGVRYESALLVEGVEVSNLHNVPNEG